MSISFVPHSRKHGAKLAAILARIGGAVRALCNVASPRPVRSDLDFLNHEQLAEIGIRRFSQRERWLDGRETSLPSSSNYGTRPNDL
ncbi:hypothetical protein [Devosia sp. LjRoot3]|uniref:hypothetical protein n=1 Tax=Devosia sp. LjRoot3 TaxID=3342319 RepID=UPI003ECC6A08